MGSVTVKDKAWLLYHHQFKFGGFSCVSFKKKKYKCLNYGLSDILNVPEDLLYNSFL